MSSRGSAGSSKTGRPATAGSSTTGRPATAGSSTTGKPATAGSSTTGRPRTAGSSTTGRPATGRPAATGTQVTNLNAPAEKEFNDWYRRKSATVELDRQRGNVAYENEKRAFDNIYRPLKQMELGSEERKTDRNAKAQEKVAALQAQASMFGSAEQTKQSKEQAEAQKHAASASASATKDAARSQADAQKFAANVDAAARQFDTKTKGRTEFSGLLANLAASVGNRSGQSMSDIFNAATQAAGVASQNKESDKDRMADMYKSIMATYNTGSGQFKYW